VLAVVLAVAACWTRREPAPITAARPTPLGHAVRLPDAPPSDAACVGFTEAGDGALVITTRHDAFAPEDSQDQAWLGFVMIDDRPPPVALDHLITARDAATWRSERAELDAELSTIRLVPCVAVECTAGSCRLLDGTEIHASWDPMPAVNLDDDLANDLPQTGRVVLGRRVIANLTSGPHDGSDHEELGEIYRSETGDAVAVLIRNADTGLRSQRFVVARARP
jgi:hypothetical protein